MFSNLDLTMAYHRVPVTPVDVKKTAFITHVGRYKMIKIPFGLCNARSIYQRLMPGVLQCVVCHICLAYLDDVIVCLKKQ